MAFELDAIVQAQRENTDYYKTKNPGMLATLPQTSLIIWEKPGKSPDYSNPDEPLRVWTLDNGQARQVADPQGSIARFHQKYMSGGASNQPPWAYYEFSILSITPDGNGATVFFGSVCGPTCGAGFLETLQRDASGKWRITDKQSLWQA